MTISAWGLIGIALFLWLLSRAMNAAVLTAWREVPHLDSTPVKVALGLIYVAKATSFATLIAAIITFLGPVFGSADLTQENVAELNTRIQEYREWLDRSWVILVGLTGTLLAAIWYGRTEVTVAQAQLAGRVVKTTSTAKMLVGLLTCFTFTSAGLESIVEDRKTNAEAAEARVRELQAAVFTKVRHRIQRDLVATVLEQTQLLRPQIRPLVKSYRLAGPYIPGRPVYEYTPVKPNTTGVPDLSPAEAEKVRQDIEKEDLAEPSVDALIEDLVEVGFDKGVSDTLKETLLHIENPLLGEIVSAFLDPIFAERAEKFLRLKASEAMKKHLSRQERLADTQTAAKPLSETVATHIVSAGKSPFFGADAVGDRRWESVRDGLRRGVNRGFPGKSEATRKETREMMASFDEVWAAARIVIPDPRIRAQQGEKIFSNYLSADPRMAAIWGYAVISATPPEFSRELTDLAIERGPGEKKIKLFREMISRAAIEPESNKLWTEMDPGHKLRLDSPSEAFNRAWYKYHGPYPEDGYIFYSRLVNGPAADAAAASYYTSDRVSRWVGIICPNGPPE